MPYTPVFDSIYTGTLYGKWPTAAVWASLLPLFDRHGHLDMSYEAICGLTGWPRDLLEEGIRALMEPDPNSRNPDEDGRRLVPIDPGRPWGWKAVNHGKYAEKARKMARQAEETASGRDAARKRLSRVDPTRPAMSGDVQQRPAMSGYSGDVPLSDSDSDSDSKRERDASASPSVSERKGKRKASPRTPIGDLGLSEAMRQKATERYPDCDPERMFEQFRAYHEKLDSRFASWPAAWVTWIGNAERFGYPKRGSAKPVFGGGIQ